MTRPALLIRDVRRLDPLAPGSGSSAARDVWIDDGRVLAWVDASRGDDLLRRQELEVVEGNGRYLLPGWVDIQVNDIEWLAGGLRPPAEHARRIREVLRHQAARGVTSLVLATLAAPEEEITAYLEGMARVLEGGDDPIDAALIGALLEGTFMNPAFHGAHNPDHVHPPSVALLEKFRATGALRLVNVAPEMSLEALEVIAAARRQGLVVGVGHARPSAERVREAIEAGLRYVIHLGNGPTGSSLKSFGGGGLYEETLHTDSLVATIIPDGYHLDPRLVRDIIARKTEAGVVAVSDAGFATGNPEGEFEVFGVRGAVSENGEYLRVVRDGPVDPLAHLSSDVAPLFGSASDMQAIFRTLLGFFTREMTGIYHRHHPALGIEEALRLATRLCSTNPARLAGLEDRGTLAPGERADALLVDVSGPGEDLEVEVHEVFLEGRRVGA